MISAQNALLRNCRTKYIQCLHQARRTSKVSADEVRYGVPNPLEDRCGPVRERGSYENKFRHGDQVSYLPGLDGRAGIGAAALLHSHTGSQSGLVLLSGLV